MRDRLIVLICAAAFAGQLRAQDAPPGDALAAAQAIMRKYGK